MLKKLTAAFAIAAALTFAACSVEEETAGTAAPGDSVEETVKADTTAPEPKSKEKAKPEPKMTSGQRNALETAESYLQTSAFSKSGLIEQLKFEDYSTADARWAVRHVEVDWKEQAAKSAESYLETSSFSRQGLIEQLEFEGFTPAQASYGVKKAYH